MLGIDADYGMSRAYSAQSWPTFVVVDPAGIIRFHGFDSDRQLGGVRRCLKDVLQAAPKDPKQIMDTGIAFPAEVLACRRAARDRSPRLAFDKSGTANVVYYSNREGTNTVYLRRLGPKGAVLSDERLRPAGLESYHPDAAFDSQGGLWAVWCARSNSFYDIYVQHRAPDKEPALEQLTASDDDAMSPKIAAGPNGTVLVSYYKWAKLRGISRDRNIFARRYDPAKTAWEPEVEISPHEPEVEDHTDPDVVVDREGRAWVVWSYDYHPQLFSKPVDASQPTIFAAEFTTVKASDPILVGATGRLRDAIDLFPSAAIDDAGVLWCAWDCSEPRRSIQLARKQGASSFQAVRVLGEGTCSTPELSAASGGRLLLSWTERTDRQAWQGKVALLKDGQVQATTRISETGDVLFPQVQQTPDGRYWIAYEHSAPKGATIIARDITAELK